MWETKKIEKTHAKENNQMDKTIFTWFGNLPRVNVHMASGLRLVIGQEPQNQVRNNLRHVEIKGQHLHLLQCSKPICPLNPIPKNRRVNLKLMEAQDSRSMINAPSSPLMSLICYHSWIELKRQFQVHHTYTKRIPRALTPHLIHHSWRRQQLLN